jgi:hypothetical protein
LDPFIVPLDPSAPPVAPPVEPFMVSVELVAPPVAPPEVPLLPPLPEANAEIANEKVIASTNVVNLLMYSPFTSL